MTTKIREDKGFKHLSEVKFPASHQQLSFDAVIGKIVPRYIKFSKTIGIKDVGKYYKIDYKRRTIILGFKLRKNLIYPVLFHFSFRRHYTTIAKVCNEKNETGHFYSACNALLKYAKKRGHNLKLRLIRDRTIFLICDRYTRSVKGTIKKTISGISIAAIVIKKFIELDKALKMAWSWVYNYISARLSKLRQKLRQKKVKAFGEVAVFEKNLSLLLDFVSLFML